MIPLDSPLPPMEALTGAQLPRGDGWQYEPKWDGFRCIAAREGERVALWSKSGQPLGRYFPDVVARLAALGPSRFVLDGELVIARGGALDFGELQLRLHPAESRVRKLAAAHPATYLVFDLLVDDRARSLLEIPLAERRPRLEDFAARAFADPGVLLSPATRDARLAASWLAASGADLDGVMAKRLDAAYLSGERAGMVKVKRLRTADCVVGGFRYGERSRTLGSLLLGLFDEDGRLHNVGYTSSLARAERERLTQALEQRAGPPGFTGASPGGPSRWDPKRDTSYVALPHELVVEVQYDHFTGGRFRHGTKLLRFRPDKAPRQCTLDQVERAGRVELETLVPRAAE